MLGLLPTWSSTPPRRPARSVPHNLLALTSAPELIARLDRVGLLLGLVWLPAVAGLAVWRLVRASPAARWLAAPVLVPAVAFLGLVTAGYAHGLERGFLSNDDVDQRLWIGQAAALGAVVIGVILGLGARTAGANGGRAPGDRARATRRRRARFETCSPMRSTIPRSPSPTRSAPGCSSTSAVRPSMLPAAGGRAVTPLVRGGTTVALLVHRPELLDEPGLLEDVGAAAGLALDHERLQAETRSQLDRLRASRARTVQAGDRARRQLERDLHDGAQQRLVVLALALRLLRAELDAAQAGRLDAAEAHLRAALAELRALAHGIYPAVLVDEASPRARGAHGDRLRAGHARDVAGRALRRPRSRPPRTSWSPKSSSAGPPDGVTVRAARADDRLRIEIESAAALGEHLVELEDRIGALDGELTLVPAPPGQVKVCAELPCGS